MTAREHWARMPYELLPLQERVLRRNLLERPKHTHAFLKIRRC